MNEFVKIKDSVFKVDEIEYVCLEKDSNEVNVYSTDFKDQYTCNLTTDELEKVKCSLLDTDKFLIVSDDYARNLINKNRVKYIKKSSDNIISVRAENIDPLKLVFKDSEEASITFKALAILLSSEEIC